MADINFDAKVAVLENELKHINDKVIELTVAINSLEHTVNLINQTLSQAKGSWNALIAVGSVSAAVGAGISWLIDHFAGK